MPKKENNDIKIMTADEYLKAKSALDQNKKKNLFIAEGALGSLLNELNTTDKSYLKETLEPYANAIQTLKNLTGKNELNQALKTMSGFKDFLLSENNGKTNYRLILDDQSLLGENADTYSDNEVAEYILTLSNIMNLGITVQDLAKAAEKKEINPDLETRKINTEKIETYDQLNAEKAKGKNFLDHTSKEYDSVSKMQQEVSNFCSLLEKRLDDSRENGAKPDLEVVDILNRSKRFAKSIQDMREGLFEVPRNTQRVESGLKEFVNYLEFLNSYSSNGNTMYNEISSLSKSLNDWKPAMINFISGINNIEKVIRSGYDISKIAEKKNLGDNFTKTGDVWIKSLRQSNKNFKPEDYIATIFAVRMISGCGRDDFDTLSKSRVSSYNVIFKRNAILEHPEFKNFMETLNNDPKKMATAMKHANSTGHGGALEDMFREYLLNKPAGELTNDPLLARYMPTALDRIEVLQEQAKTALKEGKTPEKAMAEIAVVRDFVRATHNSKETLKVKIPANGKLQEETNTLANSNFMKKCATNHPEITNLIKEGHGGKMVEEINKGISGSLGQYLSNENRFFITYKFNVNKFPNKLAENSDNAKKLFEEIKAEQAKNIPNKGKLNELGKIGKEIIAESIALNALWQESNYSTDTAINWKKINKAKTALLENEVVTNVLFKGKDINEISKRLESFGTDRKPTNYCNKATADLKKALAPDATKFGEIKLPNVAPKVPGKVM